jgi:amino acid transporter
VSDTSKPAPSPKSASLETAPPAPPAARTLPRVIVLTTVMLTFISFWRAAAMVLNDLASTAYYIGGIAENAVGQVAPWFIFFVMLFAMAVRLVYMESCSMFVRGGVYRIVKEAMGHTMAKIAVSALVFDFVLTGPISCVTAGHYIHNFIHETAHRLGASFPVSSDWFAMGFGILITAYFWWLNTKGVDESSEKALKIMIVTVIMVAILNAWSLLTVVTKTGWTLPPLSIEAIKLNDHALGWLQGLNLATQFVPLMLFICLGHTLLAMSGEEALAQVYREIEAPKKKNLIKTAMVIFAVSITFTGFCTFWCFMIVPQQIRLTAGDNLLNALVLHLIGPDWLKLLMVAFVVKVGVLILAGAVNTSIFASNAVLNRVAEDGILADWFRKPHHRFGTTYRVVNLVTILQIITILASHGNVKLLGEAYAFGVIWSFAFMSLSMLRLRFRYPAERAIKVPLNPVIGGVEIPVGLGLVCFILVGVALTNLFTKPVATVSGIAFTAAFFVMFQISHVINARARGGNPAEEHREKFLLETRSELVPETVDLPGDNRVILVPMRDPGNLSHLAWALESAHGNQAEIVAMTVKVDRNYRESGATGASSDANLLHEGHGMISPDEEHLFTRVVELAEKFGESVAPIVVPSNNSWFAIMRTALELRASEIIVGQSGRLSADDLLTQMALMWGRVTTGENRSITLRVIGRDGQEQLAATI